MPETLEAENCRSRRLLKGWITLVRNVRSTGHLSPTIVGARKRIALSECVRMSAVGPFVLSRCTRLADKQTDRGTNRSITKSVLAYASRVSVAIGTAR